MTGVDINSTLLVLLDGSGKSFLCPQFIQKRINRACQVWGNGKPRASTDGPERNLSAPITAIFSPNNIPNHPQHQPPVSGEQNSTKTGDGAKRKAEHNNGTHTRSKRNRYISIAWYDARSRIAKFPKFPHVHPKEIDADD
ncbi:hypothetical protein EYZ11_003768 [Aspergillus tanneri]|uniref:Uncharacterized protein n=1 Tax=Aspergillus tanneri TaxID=1220188 RepID=A0A4S3JM98_9EURO|nr:hypothetical protein EYZ11_003768 [Aspergillus tanneri]